MRSINLVDLVQEVNKETYVLSMDNSDEDLGKPEFEIDDFSKSVDFYKSLTEEQKALIYNMIKNSAWNVASRFFAWLDGVYFLENQTKDLELRYEGEASKLNGYLHDIWIEIHQGGDIEEMREFYSDPVFYRD